MSIDLIRVLGSELELACNAGNIIKKRDKCHLQLKDSPH